MSSLPDLSFELAANLRGLQHVAGVDEVGRGPLCGPVLAAAVRLDPARISRGAERFKETDATPARSLVRCDHGRGRCRRGRGHGRREIDEINILRASHVAMCRAVAGLSLPPDHVLVDGNMIPQGIDDQCRGNRREGRQPVAVDRGGLHRRQGVARPHHGGFGATASRLWLGTQRRLPDERPPRGAPKSWCDPTS